MTKLEYSYIERADFLLRKAVPSSFRIAKKEARVEPVQMVAIGLYMGNL